MLKERTVLGFMSGTSGDGVDVALLKTDGDRITKRYEPYCELFSDEERTCLFKAMELALQLGEKQSGDLLIQKAETCILEAHVRAFDAFKELKLPTPELIGFHGQTLLHAPEKRLTWQIGDPQKLADVLGIPVIGDLRLADVAAGGQGAPLAPVYHHALVRHDALEGRIGVLNIGGVANITCLFSLDPENIIAFDTGPGNAMIDDLVREKTGGDERFDNHGAYALRGRVNASALAQLLDNPYFRARFPKSLDRGDFSLDPVRPLSLEDGAATLVAFTVESIAQGIEQAGGVETLILCGGGVQNPAILAALRTRLEGAHILSADEQGWSAAFMEAEAFAYLAARSFAGLPITFKGTTGVSAPMTGGRLYSPAS